jgi:hypothetical protein
MSPSLSGLWISGSFAIFSEVSSVSTTDPEGPEDRESGAFIAKEFAGVDEGSRVITLDVEKPLGAFMEDFQPCDHVSHLLNFWNFQSIYICIKGILLYELKWKRQKSPIF